jgi:hypothetical protein
MNNPPNKTRRMALMLSGGIDALIGSVFLLIGLKLFPIDITQYGLESWYAILLGGLFFILGVVVFAYNFSRLEE